MIVSCLIIASTSWPCQTCPSSPSRNSPHYPLLWRANMLRVKRKAIRFWITLIRWGSTTRQLFNTILYLIREKTSTSTTMKPQLTQAKDHLSNQKKVSGSHSGRSRQVYCQPQVRITRSEHSQRELPITAMPKAFITRFMDPQASTRASHLLPASTLTSLNLCPIPPPPPNPPLSPDPLPRATR